MTNPMAVRRQAEQCARLTLLRLLCAVSVWRTVMTRILPLCGAAAWWTALICLLPGLLTAALLRLILHLTQCSTLAEAARACGGRLGVAILCLSLTVLLTVEGISSVTALITLFTEGVGTRGTQFSLAVLTGVFLLCSLHREGLARAAFLMRWGLLAAFLVLIAAVLPSIQLDSAFPLHGEGDASVQSGLSAGMSLGWPLALLLTVPPTAGERRLRSGILPVFLALGAVLLLTLTVPHERLVQSQELAECLLLPARYTGNALRVLTLSLLMLSFFLSIGAAVQLATAQLLQPWRSVPAWLPHALLAALVLTQTADIPLLWQLLGRIEPWLLAPLLGLGLLGLLSAMIRRNRI